MAVNCWSVSMASRTQTENFQNGFDVDVASLHKLSLAFYNGLYTYGGWFYLNFVSEEVINPNRNIPLAVILSMVTVTVFYVLINAAYYTVITPAELLLSDAVAVTFANRTLHWIAFLVPVLVALSCLGTLNGTLFGSPRMFFVGSREGHWPVLFSMIHIRRRTPLPAILLLYPFILVTVITGEIYQLINLTSAAQWFFISLVTLGLLLHRYRFPLHPRPFKVPIVITVIFPAVCLFIVGVSLYSDPWNTGKSLALTLTGVPVYYVTIYCSCLPNKWRRALSEFSAN
ncbi:cystine/glutamate transporter-like [Thalassophryne amazonica]|uniref:cystine/glutamate transporter-like n=1 Tax=Thalassophryne amazonica TaxID=390379 RepID=UPI001470D91F|nr:cystine/glutamate transporter-like [Thalassophryne amazonica]